jgi:C-terminal processing protease CtpA/Prc
MQWVQETVNLQTVNLNNTYDGSGNKVRKDFKLKFALKPIFSVAIVRKNSPADASGLQVGDFIRFIKKLEVYNNTLQSIFNLLKSKEGKWLYFDAK